MIPGRASTSTKCRNCWAGRRKRRPLPGVREQTEFSLVSAELGLGEQAASVQIDTAETTETTIGGAWRYSPQSFAPWPDVRRVRSHRQNESESC
jgi:hypothetical protein